MVDFVDVLATNVDSSLLEFALVIGLGDQSLLDVGADLSVLSEGKKSDFIAYINRVVILTTAWSSRVLLVPLSILFVAVSLRWFSMRRFRRAPSIFFCFSTDRGVVGKVFLSFFLGVR